MSLKDGQVVPLIVLGALGGWMVRALVVDSTLTPSAMLTAAVTVLMGWSIQRALRRQGELDKVPIEAVSRLCEQVEQMLQKCLDVPSETQGTDKELNKNLRLLSNEILWLEEIIDKLQVDEADAAELQRNFFALKTALTYGKKVELFLAAKAGRAIRTTCLLLQWQICKSVLETPADLSGLAVKQKNPGNRRKNRN